MNYSGEMPDHRPRDAIIFREAHWRSFLIKRSCWIGVKPHKLGCLQNDEQIIKNIKKGSTMENKEIKMINHKTFTCANPCFDSKGIPNDETTDPTQERNRPLLYNKTIFNFGIIQHESGFILGLGKTRLRVFEIKPTYFVVDEVSKQLLSLPRP